MKTIFPGILLSVLILSGSAPSPAVAGEQKTELERALEVINVLRARYVDRDKLSDELLNEASVAGILQHLGVGAVIVGKPEPVAEPGAATETAAPLPTVARSEIIDPQIGYVRLQALTAEAPAALDAELKRLADENAESYILDLRFATGTDYEVAAAVVGRFLDNGQKLFTLKRADGADREFRAQAAAAAPQELKARLAEAPLMVLVNADTSGSAEAVAGALRARGRCLVIGTRTAGSAVDWEDVTLSDGRLLRLASAKVVVEASREAAGLEIFPGGVTPDIPVKIEPAVERDAVLRAAADVTLTATLHTPELRKGMSEADLARAHRGEAVPSRQTGPGGEPEPPYQVQDIVLQRAVDVLKGIRALLSWQASS
jgi:hypothetical protein